MDFSEELIRLFESDQEGLFTQREKPKSATPDDRLTASFRQITEFVEANDRMPDINADDISEASLAARLNSIKTDKSKVDLLRPVDSLGLLDEPEAPESIEDLFSDDAFGLFDNPGSSILNVKNVPNVKRAESDFVAKRKPVDNFDKFRDGFKLQQQLLESGDLKLVSFTDVRQLQPGRYYVSGGQMCFVDAVGLPKVVHGRLKERLRVVFENGTESNMFLRSLSSQLYDGGFAVVDKDYTGEDVLLEGDSIAGYVYVLRSKSDDERVASIKDLYKIGFSTTAVAERIKNAISDPTYLMSEVEVVDSYVLTGDYIPQRVEYMIHRIFADAKVELTIINKDGRSYTPSEWYSVPRLAIEQAVAMIQSGDIVNYHYNKATETIIRREDAQL